MATEDNQKQFLETLANAILQWQTVETFLFLIFELTIQCKNRNAGSAVFHSVINFNTRLSMTDAAVQVVLAYDPLLPTWNNLYDRMNKRSKRRNELVHFMLIKKHFPKASQPPILRLEPSIVDIRRHYGALKTGVKKSYSAKHIEAIRQSFRHLSEDMGYFVEALTKRQSESSPPKPS